MPGCLRDFQARWESRFLDFSTERLFNSLFCCCLEDGCALAGGVPQPAWSVRHAERAVQMLVHNGIAAGQGAAPSYLVNLQGQILKADGVIPVDGAFELQREDQVQIAARTGGEGRPALGRGSLKAAVELRDRVLAQKAVGIGDGADCLESQFLRQPCLPGGETAFRASARLGRVSRNPLHAQIAQRPSQLRHPMRIHLAAGLGREPEMA